MRMPSWEESQLTFMIYLNQGMTGGETRFFADMEQTFLQRPYLSVQPKEGMALAFMHSIWHEGAVVRNGKNMCCARMSCISGSRRYSQE
jgi:prolyl 4-hydroxylase